MRRIGFCSDIHLDHSPKEAREKFYKEVLNAGLDYLVVTGDISNSVNLSYHLLELDLNTGGTELLYVLGNHDYWQSSIQEVREQELRDAPETYLHQRS